MFKIEHLGLGDRKYTLYRIKIMSVPIKHLQTYCVCVNTNVINANKGWLKHLLSFSDFL